MNVGLSVSRVGGATQSPALRQLAGRLRLEYAQFLELETFARFGALVDERSRQRLERGRQTRWVLRQPTCAPMPLTLQVALLLALEEGLLDGLSADASASLRARLQAWVQAHAESPALTRLQAKGTLEPQDRARLLEDLRALVRGVRADAHADAPDDAEATAARDTGD